MNRNTYRKNVGARVVAITAEEVLVDIAEKFESRLSVSEWKSNEQLPQVGDVIEVFVDDEYDVDNRPTRVMRFKPEIHVYRLLPAIDVGHVCQGRIDRQVPDGFLIDIGINVLLPNDAASAQMLRDPAAIIGKQVTCKVTYIDEDNPIVRVALVDEMVNP